ncbi:cytochrome P450 [Microbacterium sp. NPDC019599]|uniref:cytochrome P450 n=1 Tax=Microbacterium sp. NPDC019599 TaxID=3154690 RepID=UPI003407F3C2
MQAPAVGPVAFTRGVRRGGFLDFAGELWREHGDVFEVHLGPRTLFFAMHPDAVEHVTVSGRQHYDKGKSYDVVRRYLIGEGLVGSTGDLWKQQRKLMAPFFTPRGIQAYADVIMRDAVAFADRWNELSRAGTEIDMSHEMTLVTASIILRAMFSTQATETIDELRDAVSTMLGFADAQMVGIRFPLWVPTPRNTGYRHARDLVHGTIADVIAERRAIDESLWPDDLLSRLMQARDAETGEAMSETLLRDESITIYFAGHETTARTLTFAWYALAQHPEVAARLHDEVDGVLGDGPPTLEQLHALPYTLQVVKEVLRLYPAAPFYARDAVDADAIGPFDVPANATVMLSPYYTHRHPGFWPDPERFDPDRWTRDAEHARHGHAYHPFAAGPRICIGNNFSLLESHLLLAVLARRFAPRLREGYRPRWLMRGTLTLEDGLPMTILPR